MAIVTRPPETPFVSTEPAPGRRRWPRRLVAAVILLVVLAAAASFVWLDQYQPLVLGSGSYGLRPASEVVTSFDAQSYIGDFEQRYVRWDVGRTMHMTFPVWNFGRFPVTIDGVLGDQVPRGTSLDVRITGWGSIAEARMTSPATSPITLAPGEGMQVLVDVRMIKPVARSSGSIVSAVDLTYSTFGMHHRITMPMGQTLYLCGGPCPP